MKFEINRASIFNRGLSEKCVDPNVPGAYKETLIPYEGSEEILKWYVDIGTLEELMALVGKVGELIFNGSSITVYDDYMES